MCASDRSTTHKDLKLEEISVFLVDYTVEVLPALGYTKLERGTKLLVQKSTDLSSSSTTNYLVNFAKSSEKLKEYSTYFKGIHYFEPILHSLLFVTLATLLQVKLQDADDAVTVPGPGECCRLL